MSTVNVVIPVLKGRMVFIVDKGRPWSIVEHLILEALTKQEWTAADMATAANISRRVIVEAYIRLMRAGWVELSHNTGSITFKANARGVAAAKHVELPSVLERKRKPINYIIDLVAGDVFRNREWSIQQEQDLKERSKKEEFVWIEPVSNRTTRDSNELIDVLLDEDETFVDAEPSGTTHRYVVATVKDGIIDGLPTGRELPELRNAILAAATQSPASSKESKLTFSVPGPLSKTKSEVPEQRDISFNVADLVLDGEAHKEVIRTIFAEAKSKILIHSTFIDEERFLTFLPDITNAVQRGVRVHVFWGQNEEVDRVVSTQSALSRIRKNPAVLGLGASLIIHPFSTESHAKLLVADAGDKGEYVAIVGSCNWFTSNFSSYEVSVQLRDPRIVRDVVKYLSQLSCVHDGIWSDLASELVNICQNLETTTPPSSSNARASVVIGAQHNHFVLKARDEAKTYAFVTSHRLGTVSSPSVIVPLMAAVEERGIKARIYYCRRTAPIRAKSEAKLVEDAVRGGVFLTPVESPRLHAKVLAWDEDSVLITSLNWLSADPIELDSLKEIGVWIQAKAVARVLVNHFSAATGGSC